MNKNKIVLCSGRFDPVHEGHLDTISDLGQIYKKVIVVVLDHEKQVFPLAYRLDTLEKHLNKYKGNYEVDWNTNHFEKITRDQLQRWTFDYWVGGNLEVMRHLESIGIKCIYVQRSGDITGADLRLLKRIKDNM